MEGLDNVQYLIQGSDWLVTLNLQGVNVLVLVAAEHHKYWRFFWRGVLYEYICLPFGLCCAPEVFSKLLKPRVGSMRKLGIRLVIYLDDIGIMGSYPEKALSQLHFVADLFTSLDFLINWGKSDNPSQLIEFLWLEMDTVLLSFSLPRVNVNSFIYLCQSILGEEYVKLRKLAKVLGYSALVIPSVPYDQGHSRFL